MSFQRDYEQAAFSRTKMPKDGFKSIAELREFAARVTTQWVWSWTETSLKQYIYKQLDPQIDSLIMKILGLKKDYHGWDVDHCNGRMSVLRDIISDTAKDTISVWLDAHLESVLKTPLTKTEIQNLQKEYKHVFFQEVKERVVQQAHEDASKVVDNAKLGTDSELQKLVDEFQGLDLLAHTDLGNVQD